MSNKGNILFHFLGCLLFLSFPILLSPQPSFSMDVFLNQITQRDLISYSIAIIFFYVSYFYLIPDFYFKKKYVQYLFFLVLFFLLIVILPRTLINIKSNDISLSANSNETITFLFEIKHHVFLFFVVLFGTLVLQINSKLKISQNEKLVSELSYLKAQINPHFLFNTLNSIYSLAIENSAHTAKAIVTLSGMMRYTISDTSSRYVSLEKEINYLNSYIELQRIRFGYTVDINFTVVGEFTDKEIAPLLLIPFIENAFKHGVNPEETSQIDIQISISDTYLYLYVFNLKVSHKIQHQLKTGFGLENGRRQLKLLYPEKHTVKIENKNLSFTVTIKIKLV